MHSCRTPVFTTAGTQKWQLLSSSVTVVPTPQRAAIKQGEPQIEKQQGKIFFPLTKRAKISLGESLNISQYFGPRIRSAERLPLSVGSEHLVRCRSISVLFKWLKLLKQQTQGQELTERYILYQMVSRNVQTLIFYINTTEVIKTSTLTVYLRMHLLQAVPFFFFRICQSQKLIHVREQCSGQNSTIQSLQMLLYNKNHILVAVNINILLAMLLLVFTIYLQLKAFSMEYSLKNIWDSRWKEV